MQAQQIDEQSKQAGFHQEAVDFVARQGFANACFEADIGESVDVVVEFYMDEKWETDQANANSNVEL